MTVIDGDDGDPSTLWRTLGRKNEDVVREQRNLLNGEM
jgi:hypothetical protein